MAGAHLSGVMGKGERANQVRQAYRIVARDKERFSHSQPCAKKRKKFTLAYIYSFFLSFIYYLCTKASNEIRSPRSPALFNNITMQCRSSSSSGILS